MIVYNFHSFYLFLGFNFDRFLRLCDCFVLWVSFDLRIFVMNLLAFWFRVLIWNLLELFDFVLILGLRKLL